MNKIKISFGFMLALYLFFPAIASAKICHPGDKAQVLWHGTWYPATALKSQGNKCLIHYDGYGNNWDEWVGPNRLQLSSSFISPSPVSPTTLYRAGNPVQVLWKGRWYPAHIKQVQGNKLFIGYDGYGSQWDEWVGPARYR